MLKLTTFLIVVSLIAPLFGQAAPAESDAPKKFVIDDVVHPVIRELGDLPAHDGLEPIVLPVLSQSDEAKALIYKGVALLNAAWDFEAYRHFAAAAQADPDCLMAYWGICMTIGSGLPEFKHEWAAATDRLAELIGRRQAGSDAYFYPEYEREHATCAALLLTEGANRAGQAYRQMAKKYPKDHQSTILASILSIGGYDDFGSARGEQKTAEELIHNALAKSPKSQDLMTAYVLVHSVVPESDSRLRDFVLNFGRQLAKSGFPTHHQLQAFLEWKAGNLLDCERQAKLAEEGFETYMKSTGLTSADCEKWMLSLAIRANALHARGKSDQAIELAQLARSQPVSRDRANSVGGVVYLWDARTLEARIRLDRAAKGDFQKALDSLPKPNTDEVMHDLSSSVAYLQALSLAAQIHQSIEAGELDKAAIAQRAFGQIAAQLTKLREPARLRGEMTEWFRSINAMRAMEPLLRGALARKQGDAKAKRAWLWFSAAAEQQGAPTLFRAPLILSPAHYELAREYLRQGKNEKAEQTLSKGLAIYPNHLRSMKLLATAYKALDREADAQAVQDNIDRLTQAP